ncbi:MAG: biotin transporter BioY [Lachnospiraceae bacterium]|nr:biotin transporter BioY [Lachnospiraceae bacterium]
MKTNIQKLTFTALMAALLCILAPISIPLPEPMPAITLAYFAVYISACIIGPWHSCASIFIYILLGIVGLPVFSKGQAGLQVVVGPTGGYILGYFLIAICTGIFVKRFEKKFYMYIIGMVIGTLLGYTIGTIWLGVSMHLSAGAAIAAGVTPFLLGDAVKIAAAATICYPVRRQLVRMLPTAVAASPSR